MVEGVDALGGDPVRVLEVDVPAGELVGRGVAEGPDRVGLAGALQLQDTGAAPAVGDGAPAVRAPAEPALAEGESGVVGQVQGEQVGFVGDDPDGVAQPDPSVEDLPAQDYLTRRQQR